LLAVLQGVSALAACAGVLLFVGRDQPPEVARALAFTTLVVAVVVLVFANRSKERTGFARGWRTNRALLWLVVGTGATLAAVLFVPTLQRLLRFAPIEPLDLAIALGAGLVCLAWLEVLARVPRVQRSAPGPRH
jgi:Ca2+-transporting ATPase